MPISEQEQQLAGCYHSCLELADRHALGSIAFCCISTGEFHFPNRLAAQIAIATVTDYLDVHPATNIKTVIFNVFKDEDYLIYKQLLG
ncbi:macro domain-containing protein [Parabacteroides distasonis]|uniref:macro domain-containing protein n=1 Tax=Parabacteroides distasonis TaxID=823 RepID=UPI00232B8946|nr:macro domain-containing protein [Parabacteroides distasonis]MDB9152632.1 macro domain-containing protein [Parabacteroides distasonis]MDB9157208.1 macro domain-containing protein [Parabacteroides distasonis]MDB9166222.1 macro domain-containing protein [Parabacteroides distasonis]MDB9170642.1 macro domain-containing protein [Parabacteroides distasonis]MDB9193378.1 macro domain-containing protein [Parabacteroides distasonis]